MMTSSTDIHFERNPKEFRTCDTGSIFSNSGGSEFEKRCCCRLETSIGASKYAVWESSRTEPSLENFLSRSSTNRSNKVERESLGHCILKNNFEGRSKTALNSPKKCLKEEIDLKNFKRSLRLLGFELSDFGIHEKGTKKEGSWKCRGSFSSVRTQTSSNSIPLDCLRQEIKEAWSQDSLDVTHRKILANAAYEQWYFKKNCEDLRKKEKEKAAKVYAQEILEKETEAKKKKSQEEFQKWLGMKRKKPKDEEPSNRLALINAENAEKAFLKWKKEKDKEFQEKKRKKKEDEEIKRKSETQKKDKQLEAEKAFRLWKKKLESKNKKKENNQEEKKAKERQESRRKDEISFQRWKAIKDEEIKFKRKSLRKEVEEERTKRITESAEREQAAAKAFEEWLGQLDLKKSSTDMRIKVPWLPV